MGAWPFLPNSKTGPAKGDPMWRAQMWLAATRAARGFRGSVIQSANAVRRPVLRAGNATGGSSWSGCAKRVVVHFEAASRV